MNSLLEQINNRVDEINAIAESGDWDELDSFLENVLDIEFKMGPDKSFRGVELLITFGGPNIYVVVNSNAYAKVEGYWGGEHYDRGLSDEAGDMLYNYTEEYFSSIIH